MKKQRYHQGQLDHTMFFRHNKNGRKKILIVYIDNIIITSDNLKEIKRLKKTISKKSEVKDLRQKRYFLGMEVAKSKREISAS